MVDKTDNTSASNYLEKKIEPVTRVNKSAPKYMYPKVFALHGRNS